MLSQLPKLIMKNKMTLDSLTTPEEFKALYQETRKVIGVK
jgi:hypothetical protein